MQASFTMAVISPKRVVALLLSIDIFLQSIEAKQVYQKLPDSDNYIDIMPLLATTTEAPSFVDLLPVASQVKSGILWLSGNSEKAAEVQENFVKKGLLGSQGYSIGQAIRGDFAGAVKTQEDFYDNFLVPLAEGTPVLGHGIAASHYANSNLEAGDRALHSATKTSGAIVGGAMGGPAGAVAGAAAIDAAFTGAQSIIHGEFHPVGMLEHGANFQDKSLSDHIDQGAEVLLLAAGGSKSVKSKAGKAVDSLTKKKPAAPAAPASAPATVPVVEAIPLKTIRTPANSEPSVSNARPAAKPNQASTSSGNSGRARAAASALPPVPAQSVGEMVQVPAEAVIAGTSPSAWTMIQRVKSGDRVQTTFHVLNHADGSVRSFKSENPSISIIAAENRPSFWVNVPTEIPLNEYVLSKMVMAHLMVSTSTT